MRPLVDVPQLREAPGDIRRRLRELDPTAEIVYMGRGRWLVGKVRPNAIVHRMAVSMLGKIEKELSNGKRLSERGKEKARFALLALQGFRPVAEYTMPEPDGSVVRDFEQSRFLWLHESENETWRQLDAQMGGADEDKGRRVLGDVDLAKDAWKRMYTSNFGRATPSVQSSITPTMSSARTRHSIPA